MNINLMIDTLKIITEKSQNSIEQIIRKNKSVNQTLRFAKLYLIEMKSEIYQWTRNVLNSSKDPNKIILKLTELKESTDQQLAKHKLHILLKKKLNKLKKQSFLHSMDSHDNFFQQQNKMNDLQRSVLHIEKDLNVQQQEQQNLGISSIIQRSRMTLQHSNIKDQHNISTISQYEVINLNQSHKKDCQNQSNLRQISSFSVVSKLGIFNSQLKQKQQISQLINSGVEQKINKEQIKQNEQKNVLNINNTVIFDKKQNQMLKQQKQQKQQKQVDIVKSMSCIKVMKKKKRSVYTTLGSNLSRQDLLGNLLQQCLQNENK